MPVSAGGTLPARTSTAPTRYDNAAQRAALSYMQGSADG